MLQRWIQSRLQIFFLTLPQRQSWRFGVKQPARASGFFGFGFTRERSDDRKYVCGSQARNEIADKNTIFHYFLTLRLCRTRVKCTCRRPYQPLVYHQLPRIMFLNHLSHNWFWQLLLNHSLYRTYKLICLSFMVFFLLELCASEGHRESHRRTTCCMYSTLMLPLLFFN